ncbi:hypothetical protein [Streptomyces sp. NPDC048419]|uniref:hypothetical protein n=1 Tax=Streptomyces sp. NPDC048419 TaxID=3365547 RepID=UPI00371C7F6F
MVRQLHRAGGTVRAIYLNEALGDPETVEHVRRFAVAGEEARFVVSELPLKLVVADASLVLFNMPDPAASAGSATTLFIEHPALADCLRLAFPAVWDDTVHRPPLRSQETRLMHGTRELHPGGHLP